MTNQLYQPQPESWPKFTPYADLVTAAAEGAGRESVEAYQKRVTDRGGQLAVSFAGAVPQLLEHGIVVASERSTPGQQRYSPDSNGAIYGGWREVGHLPSRTGESLMRVTVILPETADGKGVLEVETADLTRKGGYISPGGVDMLRVVIDGDHKNHVQGSFKGAPFDADNPARNFLTADLTAAERMIGDVVAGMGSMEIPVPTPPPAGVAVSLLQPEKDGMAETSTFEHPEAAVVNVDYRYEPNPLAGELGQSDLVPRVDAAGNLVEATTYRASSYWDYTHFAPPSGEHAHGEATPPPEPLLDQHPNQR